MASTINTPTDKLDWLVSRILNQLLQFIPSYLKNTDHLIEKLNCLDKQVFSSNHLFISLDVVNLYPSIPIGEAISVIIDFATKYWSKIDSFGLTTDDLNKCLLFIAYNYEIQFDNSIYLQISGCPMGSHFSPPFAIIFMHLIEEKALKLLYEAHKFTPKIYVRYIDDILIGPVIRNDVFCKTILDILKPGNL